MANINYLKTLALTAMAFRDETVGADGAGAQAAPAAPPAPSDNVKMELNKFHFKTEKIRDDKGTVIGTGKKLPSADIYLPVPTNERLVAILSGGDEFSKERELLRNAVASIIYDQARSQINDWRDAPANKEQPVTQSVLDLSKLDWTAIANTPPSQRGSSIPSDEDVQSFLDSYLEVMPAAAERDVSKIETHVAILKTHFKKHRAQKDILEVFKNMLAIYTGAVSEEVLADNLAVVEYFVNKIDRFLTAEEKITMDDL